MLENRAIGQSFPTSAENNMSRLWLRRKTPYLLKEAHLVHEMPVVWFGLCLHFVPEWSNNRRILEMMTRSCTPETNIYIHIYLSPCCSLCEIDTRSTQLQFFLTNIKQIYLLESISVKKNTADMIKFISQPHPALKPMDL